MPLYLYGHYDSRGGAFLISATTREQADKHYLADFGMGDGADEWDTPERRQELIEEDFITEVAALESYRTIEDGEDLEYGNDRGTPEGQAFEDGLSWASDEVKNKVPNPFMEILWWNETTKTFRLCAAGVSPREPEKKEHAGNASYTIWPAPPIEEGWERSNFGEDACGVAYTIIKED